METWDDCLASLRAGAEPEEVLPKIRTLFENLPERPPSSPENTESEPPTARLFHTFREVGDYVFQLPFLRAPFFLWESLDEAEKPNERQTLFDSEMDFDLFAQFQPRFVDPPEPEVRAMLEAFTFEEVDRSGDLQKDENNPPPRKERRLLPGIEKSASPRQCSVRDIRRLSEALARFLKLANTRFESDKAASLIRFPQLSVEEWSLVFSMLDCDCEISPAALTALLLRVDQPSISRVVLQAVFPLVIGKSHTQYDAKVCTDLLAIAASRAELDKLQVAEVRALLDLYRGIDAGTLGALTQLEIAANLGKRR